MTYCFEDTTPVPNELLLDEEEESHLYEHHRLEVDAGQASDRVDRYLQMHLPNVSRNRIQQAADAGFIYVGDHPVKRSYRVKGGDVVRVMLNRPYVETQIEPENIPLEIVYEDNDLLVVNKQAGLVVHPGVGNWTGTLLNALAFHFQGQPEFDLNNPDIGLVHRIDKDTSGLLVVAKSPEAKTSLGKQFYEKTSRRQYEALVWGNFDTDEGRIEGNIGRDPRDRQRMAVFAPDSGIGKPAVTHWKVLHRYGFVTHVQCVLETGRTHQIRAHMQSIGHPLFSDARYGGDQILRGTTSGSYRQFVQHCMEICPRQVLHARTLGFRHPRTGQEMDFNSSLPEDMQQLLTRWQTYVDNM